MSQPGRSDPPTEDNLGVLENYRLNAQFDEDTTLEWVQSSTNDAEKSRTWKRGRCLGSGTFGAVWQEKREDEYGDWHYRAIKVCTREHMQRSRVDFKRELSALIAFSTSLHSGLFVNLHGWWMDKTRLFVAMDFHGMGDLSNFVKQGITEEDAKEITTDVLHGIRAMHQQGFAHRDLKPQNILVVRKRPEARRWRVKIADFGISKRVVENSSTEFYTSVGTRPYCAPEILGHLSLLGDFTSYNTKVDMWSLGCLIFNIVSKGRIAFTESQLVRYCDGNIAFNPNNVNLDISPKGLSLLKSLLIPDPRIRPTAEEALEHAWYLETSDNSVRLREKYESPTSPQPSIPEPARQPVYNSFLESTISTMGGGGEAELKIASISSKSQANMESSHDDIPQAVASGSGDTSGISTSLAALRMSGETQDHRNSLEHDQILTSDRAKDAASNTVDKTHLPMQQNQQSITTRWIEYEATAVENEGPGDWSSHRIWAQVRANAAERVMIERPGIPQNTGDKTGQRDQREISEQDAIESEVAKTKDRAERQAQDQADAERAGFVTVEKDDDAAEAPKLVNLKDRIALLQQEQSARRLEASQKEKSKEATKKRPDSSDIVPLEEPTSVVAPKERAPDPKPPLNNERAHDRTVTLEPRKKGGDRMNVDEHLNIARTEPSLQYPPTHSSTEPECIRTLRNIARYIDISTLLDLEISRDGKAAAGFNEDGWISLWTNYGNVQRKLGQISALSPSSHLIDMKFFPGSRYLATAGRRLKNVEQDQALNSLNVWEIYGTSCRTFKISPLTKTVEVSHDEKNLVTAHPISAGKDKLILWDLRPGSNAHRATEVDFEIRIIDFSPNNVSVACSDTVGNVHIFNTQSLQLYWTLRMEMLVSSLVFSPSGKTIAISGRAKSTFGRPYGICLWDISERPANLKKIKIPNGTRCAAQFFNDSNRMGYILQGPPGQESQIVQCIVTHKSSKDGILEGSYNLQCKITNCVGHNVHRVVLQGVIRSFIYNRFTAANLHEMTMACKAIAADSASSVSWLIPRKG